MSTDPSVAATGSAASSKSTIGQWLQGQQASQASQAFCDFLTKICGYTLDETFEELADGSGDSYFTDIAKDNKIIGKIPQSFQAMVNKARGIVTKADLGHIAEKTIQQIDVEKAIRTIFPTSKDKDIIYEGQSVYNWSTDVKYISKQNMNIARVHVAAQAFDIEIKTQARGYPNRTAYEAELVFKFYRHNGEKVSPPQTPEMTYLKSTDEPSGSNNEPDESKDESKASEVNAKCIVEVTTMELPISVNGVNGKTRAFKNLFVKVYQLERVLAIEKERDKSSVDLLLFYHSNYAIPRLNERGLFVDVLKTFFQFTLKLRDGNLAMSQVFPLCFQLYQKNHFQALHTGIRKNL